MASEKVTEVEMTEITPAEESENTGTDKVRETKDEHMAEEKAEEKEEVLYSELDKPTEDTYMLPHSPPKSHEDVYRKLTLYRRISAILLLLCVVLLAVLLALAVKMSEVQSNQECPLSADDVEKTTVAEVCSLQKCETMFPQQAFQSHHGHVCSECGKGWMKFEDSCYFLSETRQMWQESREECQKLGGDLVIISNERVQKFLTMKGKLMYWIGLSQSSETQQWTWINNTALTKSYWASSSENGNCAFLRAGKSPRSNWHANPCTVFTHYICQKG